MNESESLDAGLARRLRDFADEAVSGFDAQRSVALATAPVGSRPRLHVAAAITAGILVVTGIGLAASLLGNAGVETGIGASATPVATELTSEPTATKPPGAALSQGQAVDAARAAVPQASEWDVISIEAGPAGRLLEPAQAYPMPSFPAADRWVWIVDLGSGQPVADHGAVVVLDYLTGGVYSVIEWIE